MSKEILEMLSHDEHYYGEFGKQFLSNSDIKTLIEDPANFKQHEETVEILQGSYFHALLLEPDKATKFPIVKASSRNTNLYKDMRDAEGLTLMLLDSEAELMRNLAKRLKNNLELYELIYAKGNEFEVPGIAEIHGEIWKAKADIRNPSRKRTLDLKTTSDINKFKKSAWVYNYDSGAFVYEEVFGDPMDFIVACKKTGRFGIFEASPEAKEQGEMKAIQAVTAYRRFYKDGGVEDPNDYVSWDSF